MLSDPLWRTNAGQVYLIFYDGTIGSSIDTAVDDPRILPIFGSYPHEHAGGEVWMTDVTGDGLGDLIICRQDFSQTLPSGSPIGTTPGSGEGAITIIPGQASLKTLAATQTLSLISLLQKVA